MASRAKKRVVLAVGVVLVAVLTTAGVLIVWPSDRGGGTAAEPAEQTAVSLANEFLDALTTGDAKAAGELTDDAAAATTQLADVWRTLAPTSGGAGRARLVEPPSDATSATQPFSLTWELGQGESWSYESTMRLVKDDAGWRVHWEPTITHPRLAVGQSLAFKTHTGQPAVVDVDRAPLLTWAENGAVATDPAVAPLLTPGMARTVGAPAAAWYVALVDNAGTELAVLHGEHAKPYTSSLRRPVQLAAQAAVDAQSLPTMLVALQPSTGDVLAVAQNDAAGADPVALTGLYPPGSTFKIATATALLDAGDVGIDTVLPCPGVTTVGQRTVRNADFELGDVPLRTAFAESCNTTFATQAGELPLDALPAAAQQLGLGADFAIPGITTVTGKVTVAAGLTEQVENSIGQGTVQTSCFGVALMSATIAAGQTVTPRLWHDIETTAHTTYETPSATVLGGVRTMMREVVTEGRGRDLVKYGAVHGKTGTAQVGDGSQAHGWFTGFRDDVAFAVLVLDSGTSATAVSVTGAFLAAIG